MAGTQRLWNRAKHRAPAWQAAMKHQHTPQPSVIHRVTGAPAPLDPSHPPAVSAHLFWQSLLPAHWLSWGHHQSSYTPCPIMTSKVPPVQGGTRGKTRSGTSPPQAPPGARLPLLSTAGAMQGQECPTPAIKAVQRPSKQSAAAWSSSAPREPPSPKPQLVTIHNELCARIQGLPAPLLD